MEIGELWFTPRIFREYNKDLCDDAKEFKKEAERRVKKTIKSKDDPGAGNRIRLFGYSEVLEEEDFKDFPEERLTVPGNELTVIDEKDVSDEFRAFVHAPFKDDDAGDRNDTSLGMQITLYDGSQKLRHPATWRSFLPDHQAHLRGQRVGRSGLERASRTTPLLESRDVLEGRGPTTRRNSRSTSLTK